MRHGLDIYLGNRLIELERFGRFLPLDKISEESQVESGTQIPNRKSGFGMTTFCGTHCTELLPPIGLRRLSGRWLWFRWRIVLRLCSVLFRGRKSAA